jgi:hypothetical protein
VAEKAGSDMGVDRRLLRIDPDSARLDTLILLDEGNAGVSEVAEGLGISISAATGLLAEMCEGGLIEPVGEPPQEGVAETVYRLLVPALWNDEEWAELSHEERRQLSVWIIQLINSDVDEALESGTFNARNDSHASRTMSVVDEQGWRELTRIQAEALEATLAVQAESAERLAERGEAGAAVLSVMLCFEMPPRRPGASLEG